MSGQVSCFRDFRRMVSMPCDCIGIFGDEKRKIISGRVLQQEQFTVHGCSRKAWSFALFSGINQFVVFSAHIGKEEVNVIYRYSNHSEGISGQAKAGLNGLRKGPCRSCLDKPAACLKVSGPGKYRYPRIIILSHERWPEALSARDPQ